MPSRFNLMDRFKHLVRFYDLLDELEKRVGGKRKLCECTSGMTWPKRGVYFFFEPGEIRSGSGSGLRVVRTGTHALKLGSKSTLWQRLCQHRGALRSLSGGHRGSVFRRLVGEAMINQRQFHSTTWGIGSSPSQAAKKTGIAKADVTADEKEIEHAVSSYIRSLPFLWVRVEDDPGPSSDRGYLERNAIALCSAIGNGNADAASKQWLGNSSSSQKVRSSGLWNANHVEEQYDSEFLSKLSEYVSQM